MSKLTQSNTMKIKLVTSLTLLSLLLFNSTLRAASPTINTSSVLNIAFHTASSGGDVTSDGGESVTARGICWSTSPNPTIADFKTVDGSGTGSFASSLSGLSIGTTYYVRAYATNASGTSYGNEQSFTTNMPSNTALVLDGSNDYVSIPYNAALNPTSFTMEAWVKVNSFGNHQAIMSSREDLPSFLGYTMYINGSSNNLCFQTGTGSGWEDFNTDYILTTSWTHVAMSYDGTTKRVYANGVLVGSQAGSYAQNTINNFQIGCEGSGSPVYYYNGEIDEVRIWNTARTEDEIRETMYKELQGNESNLVAYYSFEDGTGTTLADGTSNSHDGTLTNMDNTDWTNSNAFTTWLGSSSSDWNNADNWSNGVPESSSNVGIYSGSNAPAISGLPEVNSMYIASSATISLNSSITINGYHFVESNVDLNGNQITLANNGYLVEGSALLYGTTGYCTNTSTLNNISNENVAGLGAVITSAANLGSTEIRRYHQSFGAGAQSIKRVYSISPTNNTGLNATLEFHYDDSEINGLTESNLVLYKSTDNGTTWSEAGGTVNTTENTITLTGIDGFSWWTAAESGVTLAIELTNFAGKYLNESVVLTWETASEKNNEAFILYRSTDGYSFEPIAEIIGAGTSQTNSYYHYTDNYINKGNTYYYKLCDRDYNGQITEHNIIEINTQQGSRSIINKTYPNPCNDALYISLQPMQSGTLMILDARGTQLLRMKVDQPTGLLKIDMSNFPNGVYYIMITNGSFSEVKKIIK